MAISTVKVQINKVYLGEALQSNGPLYVLQWEPLHYVGGLHTITVQAMVSIRYCCHNFTVSEHMLWL